MNPYETLGVSKAATQDEIKAAYRKLAKKHHPDFNPGNPTAESKFKEISAAYELVGSPDARKKFDAGPAQDPRMQDPKFWENFARGQQGPFYYTTQGDPNARYSFNFGGKGAGLDDDLLANLFGQARDFKRGGPRHTTGEFRGGSDFGEAPFAQDETYSLEIDFRDAVLGASRELALPSGRKLQVKIPPGVNDGTTLRFAAKEPGQNDVYVKLQVRPSEEFNRVGDNIESELDISLGEAVLGGEVPVRTLDGSVLLKIPKGVSSGAKLRVRGKGVPGKGDQIVTVRIRLPETPDPELEKLIAKWAAEKPYNPRAS